MSDPTPNRKVYKLMQIVGALAMAAGVTSCILKADAGTMSWLLILGGVLYAWGRLALWLAER